MLIDATRDTLSPASVGDAFGTTSAAERAALAELRVGQLLCARLCHDLIGPAAAINAGGELIREGGAFDDAEAQELIADSARQLAGRLAFFRAVFGHGGDHGSLRLREARSLAEGFLCGGRVALTWPEADPGTPGPALAADAVRLLLCLVMLGCDALPRGGRLRLGVDASAVALDVSLQVSGPRVAIAEDVSRTLRADRRDEPTPRTVHAFYLARLAERLATSVRLVPQPDGSLHIECRLALAS